MNSHSDEQFAVSVVSVTGQLINRLAENNDISEAGPTNTFPTSSSTATAVPESSGTKTNTTSVPEPIEPTQRKSIPADEAKSRVKFDELGGTRELAL